MLFSEQCDLLRLPLASARSSFNHVGRYMTTTAYLISLVACWSFCSEQKVDTRVKEIKRPRKIWCRMQVCVYVASRPC